MSAPKFTPWRIDYARCAGYIVRAADGLSLIVNYMDDNCEHGAIESEDHARLIAAAPGLYAKAERLYNLTAPFGYAKPEEVQEAREALRMELVKARGEA